MTTSTRKGLLGRQFLSLSSSRVLAAVLQAVGFLVLARIVTVGEVGIVALVTSVGIFAALVTDLGVATMLNRARAQGENELVRGAIRTNHRTAAILAVVEVGAVVILAAYSLTPWPLVLLLVSLTLERHTETTLNLFFADGNSRVPAQSIFGRRVLGLGVFVSLALFGVGGVLAYCAGQLVGNVAAAMQLVFVMRRMPGLDGDCAGVRTVVAASWPFWLSSVLNQVRVLDVTVVGAVLGTQFAGLYAAAQRVINPLLLVPAAIASVLLPHSTRLKRAEAARLSFHLSGQFMAIFAIIIPLSFFATTGVILLFGEDYRDSGTVLAVALLGLPFVALSGPLTAILQSQGLERLIAVLSGAFALLTLAGLVIGTLLFSMVGTAAALGTVAFVRCAVLLAIARGNK